LHPHAAQFKLYYSDYGIIGIYTSVKAPSMNALAESRNKPGDTYGILTSVPWKSAKNIDSWWFV